MEHKKADPSFLSDISQVGLYGEFTAADNPKVKYVVSLTEMDLTVQRVLSPPSLAVTAGRNTLTFSLKDCVGARCHREEDDHHGDSGVCFSAYFYPFTKRRMSAGAFRRRVEQNFRVASVQDPRANLEEAEKWTRAIQERAGLVRPPRDGVLLSAVRQPCRAMVLVNPHSGKGLALALYHRHVHHMLQEAGVPHTLVVTERKNHARELVREADLSQWDALVIISGDGLLFEVVNGLLEREDWEQAIHTPLGILPGGSGNALAASIHHYSGGPLVSSEELLVSCGFILCKGLVSRMDLTSVHLGSGQRLFSFLSLAWGFVADVDVESEKYRHVGAARFTVGTLVRLASLRVYRGRLSYLPAADSAGRESAAAPSSAEHAFRNSCSSNNGLNSKRRDPPTLTGPGDSLLPPADGPVPGNWVVVPEEDFVLMLAMYQSYLAEDLLAAPYATLDQGVIHLMYVKAGITRASLLKLFLAMEKGTHLATSCPHLVYSKVQALRLEPYAPKGLITVDGEAVEYGMVQAQVHRGLARMITG